MKTIPNESLEVLIGDLPHDAVPTGRAELVWSEDSGILNGHDRMLDTSWLIDCQAGRRRMVDALLPVKTFDQIQWLATENGNGKPLVGIRLDALADQWARGEFSSREWLTWAWLYCTNRGRPIRLCWATDGRHLGLGGADAIRRSVRELERLGWVSVSEDMERDQVTITPTPGDAAIR